MQKILDGYGAGVTISEVQLQRVEPPNAVIDAFREVQAARRHGFDGKACVHPDQLDAVVDAVVKLAQALGLKVVAEGVETEGQANVLRSLGCDELQGYLYAKPMSAKALALWAMNDVGPRSIEFRASLFQETLPTPLH